MPSLTFLGFQILSVVMLSSLHLQDPLEAYLDGKEGSSTNVFSDDEAPPEVQVRKTF